jgi:hypothetical protein
MTNIYLNGLNNIAPTELNKTFLKHFYYDFAHMDSIMILLLRSLFSLMKIKSTNWFTNLTS